MTNQSQESNAEKYRIVSFWAKFFLVTLDHKISDSILKEEKKRLE